MGTSRQFGGKPFARRYVSGAADEITQAGRKITLPFATLTFKITVTEAVRIYWTEADFVLLNANYSVATPTVPFDEVMQARFLWMRTEAAGPAAVVTLFGTIK